MSVLRKATPERLSALSDCVFAVLITVVTAPALRRGDTERAAISLREIV